MLRATRIVASSLLPVLSAFCLLPAGAQSYHYSWGNSRVVNQNQTGLYMPSSTYIGSGTLSRSAQNLPAGVSSGGMSGLPQTSFSPSVSTPGDNQYTDAVQYARRFGHRNRVAVTRMGAYVGQPGDNMRSDLHPYVPGQNARTGISGRANSGNEGEGTSTYNNKDTYSVTRSGAFTYN